MSIGGSSGCAAMTTPAASATGRMPSRNQRSRCHSASRGTVSRRPVAASSTTMFQAMLAGSGLSVTALRPSSPTDGAPPRAPCVVTRPATPARLKL